MNKLLIFLFSLISGVLLLNTAFGQKTYNNQKDLIDPAVNPKNPKENNSFPKLCKYGFGCEPYQLNTFQADSNYRFFIF